MHYLKQKGLRFVGNPGFIEVPGKVLSLEVISLNYFYGDLRGAEAIPAERSLTSYLF